MLKIELFYLEWEKNPYRLEKGQCCRDSPASGIPRRPSNRTPASWSVWSCSTIQRSSSDRRAAACRSEEWHHRRHRSSDAARGGCSRCHSTCGVWVAARWSTAGRCGSVASVAGWPRSDWRPWRPPQPRTDCPRHRHSEWVSDWASAAWACCRRGTCRLWWPAPWAASSSARPLPRATQIQICIRIRIQIWI